jgi:hypothetical protein
VPLFDGPVLPEYETAIGVRLESIAVEIGIPPRRLHERGVGKIWETDSALRDRIRTKMSEIEP